MHVYKRIASSCFVAGPKSQPGRFANGFASRGHAELAEYGGHVMVDRALGYEELVGDLLVAQTPTDQGQNLQLAGSQSGRIDQRALTRSPRQSPSPQLS